MHSNLDVMKYIPHLPAQNLEEIVDFLTLTNMMIGNNHPINWAIP